jgi:hypothetical protein
VPQPSFKMAQGPILVFDKSSLESLSDDESAMLDNFYRSNITPLFFVECLADLKKDMKDRRSTAEQLVGSLADRTPEMQGCANVHHLRILKGELSNQVDMKTVMFRPMVEGMKPVKLGDVRGMILQRSPEEEAMVRWTHREFLEVEREYAQKWRDGIEHIDLETMSRNVRAELGHWRKPKSLEDARHLADMIIDNTDPEWLLEFGMKLLGVPEAVEWVLKDWIGKRRPALREKYPYFVFMLTINIFFCIVLPTELLRNVKPSHQIDLAYLYYLPFCNVFTSKDRFHAQIVPLFLDPFQRFINGADFKAELKRLNDHYMTLPKEVRDTGLMMFAQEPPEDTSFLTTQMWDIYLPRWRNKPEGVDLKDPEVQKQLLELINKMADEDAPGVESHDEHDLDNIDHLTVKRRIRPTKGNWRLVSEEIVRNVAEKDKVDGLVETSSHFTKE